MAASVPESQKIDVILETNFNAAFADVAEALKPTLYEWIDESQEAICFVPDEVAYFKWKAEHRMTIGELEKHEWTKGDDFTNRPVLAEPLFANLPVAVRQNVVSMDSHRIAIVKEAVDKVEAASQEDHAIPKFCVQDTVDNALCVNGQ
ncbi:hypothetical protein K438DRAFT_2023223 [Mycena galopus ATCC 62051]|nr:hypothetical protein K438DRAFT_2023223 [Mycena galopus ATCC 62051]